MAAIANGFVAEAPSAESQAEFDAMQAAAVSQIRDTQAAAADALRTIRNGTWSDEVWEAAHAALPVLRASMVAELAVVDALEYPGPTTTTSTVPPLPTTSTTVPPLPTTSTTVPPLAHDYFDDGAAAADYFDDGAAAADYFDDGAAAADYYDDAGSAHDHHCDDQGGAHHCRHDHDHDHDHDHGASRRHAAERWLRYGTTHPASTRPAARPERPRSALRRRRGTGERACHA